MRKRVTMRLAYWIVSDRISQPPSSTFAAWALAEGRRWGPGASHL
jgi:hypothetical protein